MLAPDTVKVDDCPAQIAVLELAALITATADTATLADAEAVPQALVPVTEYVELDAGAKVAEAVD